MMTSFLFSTAYAAGEAPAASSGLMSNIVQFAPMVLIFAVFYFLLIRPQQKRQQEVKQQQSQIRRGDKIVTAGGIMGVVTRAQEGNNEIEVEIAQNVRVNIIRTTISTIIPRDKPANDDAKKLKNDDAKKLK